ncbi:hypothetical protein lerEdw1_017450 [Lerista edwardsae]|nr:hypothetical protein lerEdw1_017450 [Lerista edwardsae]
MMRRALRDALPACWVALLAVLCCCCCCEASDNVFTIRHEKSNQCIHVKNLQLLTGNCQETKETLWTWVSKHRLFNLGSQKCLQLDASKSLNRVEMVDCDSSLTLWWQCADALIFSASQKKLALKNGVVTASIDSVDTWRRSNSSDIICKQPYHDKDGIAEIFWIGLNQLDISGGWQWSDQTPLNFLSWDPEMKDSSPLDGFGCVAMSAESGQWKSYPCETALPYVCKKQFNKTKSEFPEVQNYMETRCDPNWFPHNGFCYSLSNSSASWDDAHRSCNTSNTDLISIHSIADVELVVVKLHNETKDRVWTGFMNKDTPAFFKWSDDSKVVFTYWDQDEPKIPSNSTPNCVAYSAETGRWNVLPCEEKLKYVCMKKGEILNETKSDKVCPSNEEWKKHGDFCYKMEKDEVSFGKKCNLSITNRFEQEFINSLIRKHSKVEEKYFWIGLQDINSLGEYRWGSADGKSEMLMYTNWNNLQPAFPGGCAAMSSGRYLGKWEVQDCKTFKAYSVCKKYIGPPKEPEVLPKVSDPCPPGWHNGSGLACYKERVLRTRTWEEAERFCEALGGHLPSFSNMLEVEMLHNTLRKIISDERWIWIGLNKRNPESLGSWQWSDNKPVSTVVVPYNFQEDDYDTRDCAAVKVHYNTFEN